MTRYTIDRRTWIRGIKSSESLLLRSKDGMQCCLGFICEQMGVKREAMLDVSSPHGLFGIIPTMEFSLATIPQEMRVLVTVDDVVITNTLLTMKAMQINDSTSMDDSEREADLKALFAKHDIELVFIN